MQWIIGMWRLNSFPKSIDQLIEDVPINRDSSGGNDSHDLPNTQEHQPNLVYSSLLANSCMHKTSNRTKVKKKKKVRRLHNIDELRAVESTGDGKRSNNIRSYLEKQARRQTTKTQKCVLSVRFSMLMKNQQ